MKTVNEVSKLTGVSIRTLHYYDSIGLLKPSAVTEAGYRLYDDTALSRLQNIMLFRELEFPLKDIKTILESPDFDKDKALEQQIELLTLKMEHLQELIDFAREVKLKGANNMDFKAFDTSKLEEYAKQAKETWGHTEAYKEYEEKTKNKSWDMNDAASGLMSIFAELGKLMDNEVGSDVVQAEVKKLQDYITGNYYTCTNEILAGLGKMYAAGGSMTDNIDKAGGKGTAEFAAKAIECYLS